MITLYNTLTAQKDLLKPHIDGKVTLYVCGITPYDFSHMGHGRCYVTFDVLYRLLKVSGYQVTYCRNYTDIDDKLLRRAQQELHDEMKYSEIAATYIKAFKEDMHALNCLTPDKEPYATDSITAIIAHIEQLIARGYAYQVGGDVYFRVRHFKEYGKLSKRTLDDLQAGARVEVNNKKEDPLDFALWKGTQPDTFWKSPWGFGRPGWHIECSAMAEQQLGKHIDIHAGGMDLIFPHHENEIAQSESLYGKNFANIWLHNAFVRVDKEKMSKSLGNFFTLRDVFAQVDPMVIRFYFLQHHYRSPLDFSLEDLKASQKAYARLCKSFGRATCSVTIEQEHVKKSPTFQKMMKFLKDDLNTAGSLGVVFEHLADLDEELCAVKYGLQTILGLTLAPLPEAEVVHTPEIQTLMEARTQARQNKDWKEADRLRSLLKELGVEVKDSKN